MRLRVFVTLYFSGLQFFKLAYRVFAHKKELLILPVDHTVLLRLCGPRGPFKFLKLCDPPMDHVAILFYGTFELYNPSISPVISFCISYKKSCNNFLDLSARSIMSLKFVKNLDESR